MIYSLALCVLLATGSWAVTDQGICPTFTPYADLEVVPYLGRWYEIQRYEIVWEGNQDCVMAIYSDLGDGSVEVHNTARTADGFYTDIYGSAVVIAPGTLSVSFAGHGDANYTVLATDYVNFSAVYNCDQNGPARSQYAWILSRKFPMDPASFDAAVQAFVDNGLDLNLFSPTYQGSDCPYYKPS